MRVNFLIAGVQKAGTTAVHAYLRDHPEIYLPREKELHFFDREDEIDWSNPDYADYHRHFGDIGVAKAVGEATPIYTFWPHSIERIHNYNKHMRLIVLLRDPVERAYSHWRMETTRRRETLDFSQAIREGRQRVLEKDKKSSKGPYALYSYVERGLYAQQIKKLFSIFPKDQILFVLMENFLKDINFEISRIYRFLEVDNLGTHLSLRYIYPLKSLDTGEMKKDDKAFLTSLFEDDMMETARMTKLDLSPWASYRQIN